MAVVELFAWMSELLIYRLGKVPQLNYLKFLELLGIELTRARPARAEITFPVQATFAEASVIVPLRTQVETETPDEEGPIVFETERALVALTAALDAVQTSNGLTYQDMSSANAEVGAGFQPFGATATRGQLRAIRLQLTAAVPERGNQSGRVGADHQRRHFEQRVRRDVAAAGHLRVGVLERQGLACAGFAEGRHRRVQPHRPCVYQCAARRLAGGRGDRQGHHAALLVARTLGERCLSARTASAGGADQHRASHPGADHRRRDSRRQQRAAGASLQGGQCTGARRYAAAHRR